MASGPTSPRISQINSEMDEALAQRAVLYQSRQISEVQRFESLGAQSRITGLGPKALTGQFGEDQYIDVGAFRQMHDQAITVAQQDIQKIDAQVEKIDKRLETLKAERAKLESRADKYTSRSSFPESGGCFTPDTEVMVRGGVKAIASMAGRRRGNGQ